VAGTCGKKLKEKINGEEMPVYFIVPHWGETLCLMTQITLEKEIYNIRTKLQTHNSD